MQKNNSDKRISIELVTMYGDFNTFWSKVINTITDSCHLADQQSYAIRHEQLQQI